MIEFLTCGTLSKYVVIGSETRSCPSSSSFRIAAAVNCLVMEPMHEVVPGVQGILPRYGHASLLFIPDVSFAGHGHGLDLLI